MTLDWSRRLRGHWRLGNPLRSPLFKRSRSPLKPSRALAILSPFVSIVSFHHAHHWNRWHCRSEVKGPIPLPLFLIFPPMASILSPATGFIGKRWKQSFLFYPLFLAAFLPFSVCLLLVFITEDPDLSPHWPLACVKASAVEEIRTLLIKKHGTITGLKWS